MGRTDARPSFIGQIALAEKQSSVLNESAVHLGSRCTLRVSGFDTSLSNHYKDECKSRSSERDSTSIMSGEIVPLPAECRKRLTFRGRIDYKILLMVEA